MKEIKRDGIYSVQEIAEMFALSPRTVKRLVYSGKLPARKMSNQICFVGEELLRALPAWESHRKVTY